eukprot:2067142-Amphidinium_carterae.2
MPFIATSSWSQALRMNTSLTATSNRKQEELLLRRPLEGYEIDEHSSAGNNSAHVNVCYDLFIEMTQRNQLVIVRGAERRN